MNIFDRWDRGYCAATCVALLSACATINAPTSSIGGQVVATEVPASTFGLSDYSIRWMPAVSLDIEMRCSSNPALGIWRWCPTSQEAKERANQGIAQMNQLLETHAIGQLNSRLASRGLKEGAASSIELKPQSAYWSESGWGSGVLVQVHITDAATGQEWTHLLPADSGVQVLGAWAAGPQTPEYAAAFAGRLDGVLARAGFFK